LILRAILDNFLENSEQNRVNSTVVCNAPSEFMITCKHIFKCLFLVEQLTIAKINKIRDNNSGMFECWLEIKVQPFFKSEVSSCVAVDVDNSSHSWVVCWYVLLTGSYLENICNVSWKKFSLLVIKFVKNLFQSISNLWFKWIVLVKELCFIDPLTLFSLVYLNWNFSIASEFAYYFLQVR